MESFSSLKLIFVFVFPYKWPGLLRVIAYGAEMMLLTLFILRHFRCEINVAIICVCTEGLGNTAGKL